MNELQPCITPRPIAFGPLLAVMLCEFSEVSPVVELQGVTKQRGVRRNLLHGSEDEEEGTREMRISHEAHRHRRQLRQCTAHTASRVQWLRR
jgi:hypothetical protein